MNDFFDYFTATVLPRLLGERPHNYDSSEAVALTWAIRELGVADKDVYNLSRLYDASRFGAVKNWIN